MRPTARHRMQCGSSRRCRGFARERACDRRDSTPARNSVYYASLHIGRRYVFSPELKKGSTEMLVLSLVESRPRHGYEIGKLIEARSGGRLTFALPTLYPTLLRLENRGLIKGRWVEQ